MARWFEAVLAWLGISVFLGLLFSVGGQGLLGLSSGATPSLSALTQRGQLLPASALLPVGAVLLMLRKPANLLRLERVAVGIFCLARTTEARGGFAVTQFDIADTPIEILRVLLGIGCGSGRRHSSSLSLA